MRLLFNGRFKRDRNPNLYQYLLYPLELIDEIVFDPRIEYSEFKRHKKNLKQFRFNKRIVKSTLYDIPDFNIKGRFI
ncbi:hypothetical protein [Lutibacter profundi]|uniref:hypothetical protein n=1 Tax=Lutibacter profundi TaxID=1622118 RepID=UPI0011876B91|nr:hypothetical protein [Lutibacter profundi]